MKRYGIFITALCSGWLLTGCADDENLGLTDYPAAAIGVSIAGEKSETVVMAAAYDENGLLQVDGDLAREYTVELATASPEDIRVVVEPVATNIPAEAIVVSETDLWFPAGTVRRSVSVSLADADFGFAQAERGGMTYELGLRIAAVSNPNVVMERSEAKVVVDKEAYRATCTLRGEGDTSFSRPYWDGKVFSDEPISHTFKAVLDRPASADTKITFSSAGLDEQYAGMVTVVPAELIIPAGARESAESAVWTLSNGYLEQTEPLNYTLSLLPVVTSDDPAAVAGEGLTFAVSKALQAFALAERVVAVRPERMERDGRVRRSRRMGPDRSRTERTGRRPGDGLEILQGGTYIRRYAVGARAGRLLGELPDQPVGRSLFGASCRHLYFGR